MNWRNLNRKIHYWGAISIFLSVIIMIGSGLLLLVKKQIPWVQPATIKTQTRELALSSD